MIPPAEQGARELDGLDVREALRILIAVEEGRLHRAPNGRFDIDGEVAPDRRTREALRDRGLVATLYALDGYRITPTGKGVLNAGLQRLAAAREAGT